jgi:transcriptional regulator with XRE-family HTH domain
MTSDEFKAMREAAGLSQSTLGALMGGIDQRSLSAIETGKRAPTKAQGALLKLIVDSPEVKGREEIPRREAAIRVINDHYPPDSRYVDNAAIGRDIMTQAMARHWRQLPTAVLEAMMELCVEKAEYG